MSTPELVKTLVETVAAHTGLSASLIQSDRKTYSVCKARWACFTVMRELGYPFIEIGESFHRDHAAVMHGITRGKEMSGPEGKLFDQLCAAARAAITPK